VVVIALAVTIPFINQALHIDDAIFWDFARARHESPLSQHLSGYKLMGKAYAQWREIGRAHV